MKNLSIIKFSNSQIINYLCALFKQEMMYKKFFISVIAAFAAIFAVSADSFRVSGDLYKEEKNAGNLNKMYIFSSLANAEITFSTDSLNDMLLKWEEYTDSPADASFVVSDNGKSLILSNLKNATGYILSYENAQMETVRYYIWVFDYSVYKNPQVQITAIADRTSPLYMCQEATIEGTVEVTAEAMEYVDKYGNRKEFSPYKMYLQYNTLKPNETTYELEETQSEIQMKDPVAGINNFSESLTDVYQISPFGVVLKDMNDETVIAQSAKMDVENLNVLPLVSVVGNLTIREKDDDEMYNKNEAEKGSEEEHRNINGSAPLDLQLQMYKNDVVTEITWKIYKKEKMFRDTLIRRNETVLNEEDFSKVGDYVVKVMGQSANGCISADSITVTIGDGSNDIFLEVPNVFTPNDDGLNDEFRVAYRSILKFKMWVFNRWGREVYYSTDPGKGWNGKIGNQNAATGVYFYVIEATGADGRKYDRKGSVNLLRGKE